MKSPVKKLSQNLQIDRNVAELLQKRLKHAQEEFAEALREAQRLGYAEADPSADVDGYDAAAKAAILASKRAGHATINVKNAALAIGRHW